MSNCVWGGGRQGMSVRLQACPLPGQMEALDWRCRVTHCKKNHCHFFTWKGKALEEVCAGSAGREAVEELEGSSWVESLLTSISDLNPPFLLDGWQTNITTIHMCCCYAGQNYVVLWTRTKLIKHHSRRNSFCINWSQVTLLLFQVEKTRLTSACLKLTG